MIGAEVSPWKAAADGYEKIMRSGVGGLQVCEASTVLSLTQVIDRPFAHYTHSLTALRPSSCLQAALNTGGNVVGGGGRDGMSSPVTASQEQLAEINMVAEPTLVVWDMIGNGRGPMSTKQGKLRLESQWAEYTIKVEVCALILAHAMLA